MSKVQIICSRPGMLRNGMTHQASAFYPDNHWTPAQIDAFRADPAFTVREVDETAENVLTEDDFQIAVDAEVKRRLAELKAELEAGFHVTLADAVKEKLTENQAEYDARIDSLGQELLLANEKAAKFQTQIVSQADYETRIGGLGQELAAANEKAALLQKQLDAAPAAPAPGTGKTK